MQVPVIYSDKYVISIEVVIRNGKAAQFIHADVPEWNKSTYKELKDKWAEFRKIHQDTIYAYPQEEKTAKFAEKFGFQKLGDIMRHKAQWVE